MDYKMLYGSIENRFDGVVSKIHQLYMLYLISFILYDIWSI